MKEKIYTIPVNEAFDSGGECPFCSLSKKLDEDILNYIMGPSYMEEDIREETNRYGFCKRHYAEMFQAGNRLGLALMLQTHLMKINKDIDEALIAETDTKPNGGFFRKNTAESPLAKYTEELSSSCYACKRAEDRMNSYIETFFYLWKHEQEFRDKVKNGNGFCLEHFSCIVSQARSRMNSADFSDFMQILVPIQKQSLLRIEDELSWFIKKFDYRFQNEPWKNSKDAVERAILKISSERVEP